LTRNGQLRGCIGTLIATRALAEDVACNAHAAAFKDPRFPPLTHAEFLDIRVEVSLLSTPEPITVADEADALRQIVPHSTGVVFECHGRRATFLPQVWQQLPRPQQFLAALKQKAGFPADFWSPGVCLSRYTVQKWVEQ
jgi:AmmeMemoRadiSam system protein A